MIISVALYLSSWLGTRGSKACTGLQRLWYSPPHAAALTVLDITTHNSISSELINGTCRDRIGYHRCFCSGGFFIFFGISSHDYVVKFEKIFVGVVYMSSLEYRTCFGEQISWC